MTSPALNIPLQVVGLSSVASAVAGIAGWFPPAVTVIAAIMGTVFYVVQLMESHYLKVRLRLRRVRWRQKYRVKMDAERAALLIKHAAEASALMVQQSTEAVALTQKQDDKGVFGGPIL